MFGFVMPQMKAAQQPAALDQRDSGGESQLSQPAGK